jgi:hypothetical protein
MTNKPCENTKTLLAIICKNIEWIKIP